MTGRWVRLISTVLWEADCQKRGPRMRLTDEGLKDRQVWLDHGYTLPQYDRERMRQATLTMPRWIHFGAGNILPRVSDAADAEADRSRGSFGRPDRGGRV